MGFYEKLGLCPIINASETYTKLGGSLMAPETLEAMKEAAEGFIDLDRLLDKVCEKAALLTKNDGAFVTSGASAGVILSTGACMILESMAARNDFAEDILLEAFPEREAFPKNEVLVFDGDFRNSVPYWKLIALTGAKIVSVSPDAEGIRKAVSEKTAAFVLFPAPLYEKGILSCEEAVPLLRQMGVRTIVDASAQLPPVSNLWYYTRELGADVVIFSGGKHLRGPQSTGLIAGKKDITDLCRKLASPNERLGRGFKTGKEELAGFLTALELFVKTPDPERYERQKKLLALIAGILEEKTKGLLTIEWLDRGRLGTYQPLLHIYLPEGRNAKECLAYTRKRKPAVDIGVYTPEFHMPPNLIFLNAYNLKDENEARLTAEAVAGYLER